MQSRFARLRRRQPVGVAHLTRVAALAGAAMATAMVAAAASEAADTRPPRIVAAVMQDADGDARADRMRLTYSERVRHAADRDRRYPFAVAGYRIRAVGKARGRAIAVKLVEKVEPDDAARPPVRYKRTRAQRVVDRARNQATSQTFGATRAHANRPALPLPDPGSSPAPEQSPTPPGGRDGDGDGTPDAQDCAPADPKIEPGASDLPDLAFVDSNCDGIDGSETGAIFVSPTGSDTNPGTRAEPKREIQAALLPAVLAGKDVYAAAGEYARVETLSGADIYGGYAGTTWERSLDATTRIVARPEAVLASGDRVLLQLLTVVGLNDLPGSSAYGIRAVGGSTLTLQRVSHIAEAGVSALDGADGTNGVSGGDGGDGESGSCDLELGGNGGTPGASPGGFPGGRGGRGGLERLNYDGLAGNPGTAGTPGGAGGANGNPGKAGQPGQDGANGTSGVQGNGGSSSVPAGAQSTWRGIAGGGGLWGGAGMGGGGGGGGGGQKGSFVIDGHGNGGGGGGGAGGRGTAGRGGAAGGGSFGLYLHDSTATVSMGSTIKTGDGGAGGDGGRGGIAGTGGAGGSGATHCTGELGAGGDGGDGGTGGNGGGGGGGAGGPSIGVLKAGLSSATLEDVSIEVGKGGPSGASGAGGTRGTPAEPGVARAVFP